MEHTSYSSNRIISKTRRAETIKAPWKNLEKKNYSQKWINMNSQKSNMTKGILRKVAKVWRRKLEGKKEEVCEPRIDANNKCPKHTVEDQTKVSTLD